MVGRRLASASWIRSIVMPTDTSATTLVPPRRSNTGTTARIEGPRVPVYSWVNGRPCGAVPRSPMNGRPICAGFGCE